ncbi:MAG TPA: hypothetical protein DCG47_02080 [Spirochaetaceae bacterium]|nr:hypothetical protein [Spirochaetaceae bacterium]
MHDDNEARLPGSIAFIQIPPSMARSFGSFTVDPAIPIPVELGNDTGDLSGLSWEMIVAGMLRLLAHDPDNSNSRYYRRFVLAVKQDIFNELSETGIIKAKNGELDLAEEIFLALAGLMPEAPEPILNLAIVHEDRADILDKLGKEELADAVREKAFQAYKKLLAMDPPFPDAYFNAGYFYLKTRNFDRARDLFEFYATLGQDEQKTQRAIEIASKLGTRSEADALFKEAYDFIRMGKEEEGIAKAQAFSERNPAVWNGWFLAGWGYRRLSRWEEGREAFLKAIELGAEEVDLLNELSICEMELGLLQESRVHLEKALRLEPDNIKIISNLGVVAKKQGRLGDAAGFFRTALDLEPSDSLAQAQLDELGALE